MKYNEALVKITARHPGLTGQVLADIAKFVETETGRAYKAGKRDGAAEWDPTFLEVADEAPELKDEDGDEPSAADADNDGETGTY